MNKSSKTTKLEEKIARKKKVEIEEEEDSEVEVPSSESEEEQPEPKLSGKRAKPETSKAPAKTVPPKKAQPEPESDEDEEEEEEEEEQEADKNNEKDEKEEEESDKEENGVKGEESQEEAKEEQAEEIKEEETEEVQLFLGNLPFNVTEEELKSFFEEYGDIVSVKILMRNNRPTGKAFIQFATHEEAVKAKEANGKDFNGRAIIVRLSSEPQPEKPERQERHERAPRQSHSNESTIFIGGLSYQSTQDSVSKFFGQCGNITAVRVATDQEGKVRGFAHVEFDSSEAVQEALKLSGSELDGRKIRIDVAGNKSSSGGFRGSQRGGSRGRSRGNFSFGGRGRNDNRGRGDRRRRPGLSGVVNRGKGASQQFQGKKMKL